MAAAAKLVVTKTRGGTKITLVGTSGTELLASKVFTEPRGKGATLRSLKGLLGEGIVVDDQTATTAVKSVPAATTRRTTARVAAATTAPASKSTTRRRSRPAAK